MMKKCIRMIHLIHCSISQKTHGGVSRKKSPIKTNSTRKEFINSVTDEEEISNLHTGKEKPIDAAEKNKNNFEFVWWWWVGGGWWWFPAIT